MGSSITRGIVLIALVTALPAAAAVPWREAAEYVRVFAPAGHADAYGIAVSSKRLDEVLKDIDADQTLVRTPGAWAVRSESATERERFRRKYLRRRW